MLQVPLYWMVFQYHKPQLPCGAKTIKQKKLAETFVSFHPIESRLTLIGIAIFDLCLAIGISCKIEHNWWNYSMSLAGLIRFPIGKLLLFRNMNFRSRNSRKFNHISLRYTRKKLTIAFAYHVSMRFHQCIKVFVTKARYVLVYRWAMELLKLKHEARYVIGCRKGINKHKWFCLIWIIYK